MEITTYITNLQSDNINHKPFPRESSKRSDFITFLCPRDSEISIILKGDAMKLLEYTVDYVLITFNMQHFHMKSQNGE